MSCCFAYVRIRFVSKLSSKTFQIETKEINVQKKRKKVSTVKLKTFEFGTKMKNISMFQIFLCLCKQLLCLIHDSMFSLIFLTQIWHYSRAAVSSVAETSSQWAKSLCATATSHRWRVTERLCWPYVAFLTVLSGECRIVITTHYITCPQRFWKVRAVEYFCALVSFFVLSVLSEVSVPTSTHTEAALPPSCPSLKCTRVG